MAAVAGEAGDGGGGEGGSLLGSPGDSLLSTVQGTNKFRDSSGVQMPLGVRRVFGSMGLRGSGSRTGVGDAVLKFLFHFPSWS